MSDLLIISQNEELIRKNGYHIIYEKDKEDANSISLTKIPISKGVIFGQDGNNLISENYKLFVNQILWS